MSKNVLNSKNLGDYYFFLNYIELNNIDIGVSGERAQQIIQNQVTGRLTEADILYLKTYVHEVTHLIDSTTSLWGLEYSSRMKSCFNNIGDEDSVSAFALNYSEIELHKDLLLKGQREKLDYREMRSILKYDSEHGVHLQFYYYDFIDGAYQLVHKTPVSMLSLMEGHAFAVEHLLELELHESQEDLVSLNLVESEFLKVLSDPDRTEYTCLLAFTDFLFPQLDFKTKFQLIDVVCRFCLNLPSLGFHFPNEYIDGLFVASDPKLRSSLKMELSRGMNRAALVCLTLLILKSSLEEQPFNTMDNIKKQLFERISEPYQTGYATREKFWEAFCKLWSREYDYRCKMLEDDGFELVKKIAESNKNFVWDTINLNKVSLPDIGLRSGEFIRARNRIDYDMEEHFLSFSDIATELKQKIENMSTKKSHLSPNVYHAWLTDIESGKSNFINFYED